MDFVLNKVKFNGKIILLPQLLIIGNDCSVCLITYYIILTITSSLYGHSGGQIIVSIILETLVSKSAKICILKST